MPQRESDHQQRILLSRILLTVFIVLSALTPAFLVSSEAGATPSLQSTSTPIPQPTPTFDLKRLERPAILSETPSQVEAGALKYWGVCMACHGDHGQGLTEEWRDAFGPEDRNCWQSGCHGDDHPSRSFLIPQDKIIPAVAGSDSLVRFRNAQEVHDFILASMPWWDPGQLTDGETWQVTAYILNMRHVLPDGLELTDTNASAIMTQYAVPQPINDQPAIIAFTCILILAALGLMVQDARKILELKNLTGTIISYAVREKPNFFHHLHPPTLPALQARFRYTLGAGGLSVFLCVILLITGMLEMFYYIPVPEYAAISVETITTLVPLGALIRNLHFWSAQALIVVMSIHLLRVVLTSAYTRHRRSNYLIGLGMLVLILLLDFTGYVLRWDEGIRWALIVGTNLLKTIPWMGEALYQLTVGGSQPGLSSLERFYTWHIFVLTLLTILLGVWHIFRLRRDGGIAVPPPDQREDHARISRFELVRREVRSMLIAGVILIFVSFSFPAPIERPITLATNNFNETLAPWFFLWIQQLLKLGDPFLWGVAAPTFLLVLLALLPYIFPPGGDHQLGKWFPRGNRISQIVIITVTLIILGLTLFSFLPNTQP